MLQQTANLNTGVTAMPSISYPTSLNVPGPWILDARNIEDLDRLVDSCWESMCEKRKALIDSALASWKEKRMESGTTQEQITAWEATEREELEKGYPFGAKTRKIIVYLSGGRSVEGQTFGELAALALVHKEVPRGLDLSIEVAKSTLKLRAEEGYDSGLGLSIGVSSNEANYAQELFGKLQNWATEIRPKRWLQRWRDLQWFFSFLIAVSLTAVVFALAYSMVPTQVVEPGPGPIHRQAWDLIKGGVTQANESKAIETLLELESDYGNVPVKTTRPALGLRVWMYLGLTVIVSVAFKFAPKGAIGLWGGRQKVTLQRRWIRIVSVSIPSLFLTSVLVPWLVSLAGGPK